MPIERQTPRDLDRPNVIAIKTRNGIVHLRPPSALAISKLGKAVGAGALDAATALSASAVGGDPTKAALAVVSAGDQMLSLVGAVIGKSWFHTDLDLESSVSSFADTQDWGEAVFEELYEWGLTTADQVVICGVITKTLQETADLEEAVAERVDFSGAPKGHEN